MNDKKILRLGFDFDKVIVFWWLLLQKDAKSVLIALNKQGHTIKIVTARGKFLLFLAKITLRFYKLGWLEIVGVGPNGKKYKELEDFDMFFDDKVKNLRAIEGKVKHLYIFGKKSRAGFKNLANWWEVRREIRWLSREPKKELVV